MENLYKPDIANPITAEIEEFDHQRDEIFNGIVNLLAGHSAHFMLTMKEAALLLQKDLERYGTGITRENYSSQTTDLKSIISDWSNKPELQFAMETLD